MRSPHAPGTAGLGFDIGVLDEARLEIAFDDGRSLARAASTSPLATRPRTRMLPGRLAWMSAAPSRKAASIVAMCGSSLQVTGKPFGSKRSIASALPATAATASPRKRVSPCAKTGWSAKGGMTP